MPEKISSMAKDAPGAPGVDARTLGVLPRTRFPSLDADCAPSTASLLVSYHSFLTILCTLVALEKPSDRCFSATPHSRVFLFGSSTAVHLRRAYTSCSF